MNNKITLADDTPFLAFFKSVNIGIPVVLASHLKHSATMPTLGALYRKNELNDNSRHNYLFSPRMQHLMT